MKRGAEICGPHNPFFVPGYVCVYFVLEVVSFGRFGSVFIPPSADPMFFTTYIRGFTRYFSIEVTLYIYTGIVINLDYFLGHFFGVWVVGGIASAI